MELARRPEVCRANGDQDPVDDWRRGRRRVELERRQDFRRRSEFNEVEVRADHSDDDVNVSAKLPSVSRIVPMLPWAYPNSICHSRLAGSFSTRASEISR